MICLQVTVGFDWNRTATGKDTISHVCPPSAIVMLISSDMGQCRLRRRFIVAGCERAGTTLLSAALSTAPGVTVANDTFVYLELHRLIGLSDAPFGGSKVRDKLPIAAFSAALLEALITRYGRAGPDPAKNWMLHYRSRVVEKGPVIIGESKCISGLIEAVLSCLCPGWDATRFAGEKTPGNTKILRWAEAYLGIDKVIGLVRHPLDNVGSLVARGMSIQCAVERYKMYFRYIVSAAERGHLLVRLEDFLQCPLQTINRAVSYLGSSSRVEQFTFPNSYRPSYLGSEISLERARRGRSFLSKSEHELVEIACRSEIDMCYGRGRTTALCQGYIPVYHQDESRHI